MPTTTTPPAISPERIATIKAQRGKLMDELQAMIDTPEDQRPTGKKRKTWVAELDSLRRMVAQLDQLLQLVDRQPKPSRRAAAQKAATPTAAAEESDPVVVALIPKGPRAELRVTMKTWQGRRVVDVRCWSLMKGTGEYGPTRKGVAVDARMLPALVEALQRALHQV